MGSWSSGPPTATPQRTPVPSAAGPQPLRPQSGGTSTSTCAPTAPGPSANEIVSHTLTQVEDILGKTLAPLWERLESIEAHAARET